MAASEPTACPNACAAVLETMEVAGTPGGYHCSGGDWSVRMEPVPQRRRQQGSNDNGEDTPDFHSANVLDDLSLFFRLLLSNLPLDRIMPVWSVSAKEWRLPKNTDLVRFHRLYAVEFLQDVDPPAPLWKWMRGAVEFLERKCLAGFQCKFKWEDFYIFAREISSVAVRTTLQYNMARMRQEFL